MNNKPGIQSAEKSSNESPIDDAKWIYETMDQKMSQQFDAIDKLDAKANTLLTICGVLLVFFWGIVTESNVIENHISWIVIPGVISVVIALVMLLWAHRVVKWENAPPPDWLVWCRYHDEVPTKELIGESMLNMATSYQGNEKKKKTKVKLINSATYMILLGFFSPFVILIVIGIWHFASDFVHEEIASGFTPSLGDYALREGKSEQ